MRNGTFFLLSLAACTNPSADAPDSVRERLASGSTRLAISASPHAGTITAARRTADGWTSGVVELTVEGGELVAGVDARGALRIERLAAAIGPIEIPRGVLDHEAKLTAIHLETERPFVAPAAWSGDDDARAAATAPLRISWSLMTRGETSPLGGARLPAVPVELVVGGGDGADDGGGDGDGDGGAAVYAVVRARSRGVLWSWADLVKLENLELSLTATTASR